jgi:hypothetical protein
VDGRSTCGSTPGCPSLKGRKNIRLFSSFLSIWRRWLCKP